MNFSKFYLCIYIILWAITFVVHQKRVKYFGASSFILMLYLFYSIVSLYVYSFGSYSYLDHELHFYPFIYLYGCIIIACLPVLHYNEAKITAIDHPTPIFIHIFTYIYLICALTTIPEAISNLSTSLVQFLSDNDAARTLYNDYHTESMGEGASGISNIFAIIFNSFTDVAILLFFYYLIYYPKRRLTIILYVVAILIQVLYSVSRGLRTDTTLKSLGIVVAYISMRSFMSNKQKKICRVIGVVLLSLVSIFLFAATFSRWGDHDSGLSGGTLDYIGQGNLIFNSEVLNEESTRHGDRTAGTFKYMLGMETPNSVSAVRLKYSNMKVDDSVYSTFVGDFVLDYGPYATLIIFILFSWLFCRITRVRNGVVKMEQLIAIYFCMCVVTHGGFYLFYYSFQGNLTILAFLVLYIFFHIDSSIRARKI